MLCPCIRLSLRVAFLVAGVGPNAAGIGPDAESQLSIVPIHPVAPARSTICENGRTSRDCVGMVRA